MRVMLTELGLPGFLKTSGGKGLHVVVPIKRLYGWDAVKGFSQAVVQHMARTIPQLFVAKSGPRNRVGKIFVDYLRNGFGATTVSAWSARARPGLGISVPLRWDELGALSSSTEWTVATVEDRLREGNAPWDGYAKAAVSITQAMKMLGYEPPRGGGDRPPASSQGAWWCRSWGSVEATCRPFIPSLASSCTSASTSGLPVTSSLSP